MSRTLCSVLLFAFLAPPVFAGIDRWTAAGPDGGTVVQVAVGLDGTVYASSERNGIFRSTDAGASWRRASSGLLLRTTYGLAVHPRLPKVVFAVSPGRGIFRSGNGGATWQRWSEQRALERLVVSPSQPAIVYGTEDEATGSAVWRSDDGGVTWAKLDDVFGSVLAIDPRDPDRLYLGSFRRLLRSQDGGATWAELRRFESGEITSLLIDPRDPRVVYLATAFEGTVWKSRDRGRSWAPAASGLGGGVRTVSLAVDPSAPERLYAAVHRGELRTGRPIEVGEIFRSGNGAGSWKRAAFSQHVLGLAIDPRRGGRVYAALLRTGVLRSTDGGDHWTLSARGLKALEVKLAAADPYHPGAVLIAAVASGLSAGLFHSLDAGATWQYLGDELRRDTFAIHALAFDPTTPGAVYLGSQSGVWRSADGGASWEPTGDLERRVVTALTVHPTRPGLLLAAGYELMPCSEGLCALYGLFRTEDGGGSWTPTPAFDPFHEVRPLFDPNDADRAWASAGGLFRSDDAGASWSPLPRPPAAGEIYATTGAPSILYLRPVGPSDRRLYRSVDGGASWSPADEGLGFLDLSALAIDPESPSTLYGSTFLHGIYRSVDGGASWQRLHAGLPLEPAYLGVTVDPVDPRRIYAAAGGAGGLFVFTSSD